MVHCNESSQSDTGGVATDPLIRAGLRRPPRGAEPTGVFAVIEMAVLFCVSALAMVSIIVSIDDGVVRGHVPQDRPAQGAVARSDHAVQAAATKTSTAQAAR